MYKDAEQKYRDKMIALRVSAKIHWEEKNYFEKRIFVFITQMFQALKIYFIKIIIKSWKVVIFMNHLLLDNGIS